MKKILLTESEKSKIISDKEKLIIESFVKNFNKIKRIDENMLNEELSKQITTGDGWDRKTKSVIQGNLELNNIGKEIYSLFKKEGARTMLSSSGRAIGDKKNAQVVITSQDDKIYVNIKGVGDPVGMANKYGPMIMKSFPKLQVIQKPDGSGSFILGLKPEGQPNQNI